MLRCHKIGHEATKGVANIDNVLECVICDATNTQKLDELVCDSGFSSKLYCLDQIWMIGKTNTNTIVEEGCVSLLDGIIRVGVAWRRYVPISSMSLGTVREKLDRCRIDGPAALGKQSCE